MALGVPYPDPGAAITDPNNPSYAGTITANPATVDTSSSGNKTITYTAPADAAGNMPDSITRIVRVLDAPPIDIVSLSLGGSNFSHPLHVKGGDVLTLLLNINYTIASYTATILNTTHSDTSFGNNLLILTTTVQPDLAIEKNATFSITIIDENGIPNTITQDDLTSDNIFVDTISPTVTLSPPQPSISVNDKLPTITATIDDGDPKYNSTKFTISESIQLIILPLLRWSSDDGVLRLSYRQICVVSWT